jgi:predicted ester cyclase
VPSHKRLVETFYRELWNEWNDSAVEDILDPEFEFRASLGVATVGYEGWRAYRDAIRAGSEDFHNEIVALVGDGPHAAARLRYTGTHPGTLLGVAASGRRFAYDGAAFFIADEGRLRSAWVLGDLEALRRQLNAR